MSENNSKSFKMVFVGGTGQMVLHHYLQLYLLGLVRQEFDVVVVDSDQILQSIQTMQAFIEELRYGFQLHEALGGLRIPVIKTIQISPTGGENALEVLTGSKTWKTADYHTAHAFFSDDSLHKDLQQGLFARPALSSVLSQEVLADEALKPSADSTVVIVGSVTGGTGGGLTAPILDAIRLFKKREKTPNVRIRAVFFGEYFTPDPGVIQDDVVRFQSNQTLVLRAIGEADLSDEIHSFNIVGGPGYKGGVARKPNEEKLGKNLPWPSDENNPFWQGVQALDYLRFESAMENRGPFKDREVQRILPNFTLREAQLRWRKAVQMVGMLRKKSALVRMCGDPWTRWIWSPGLVDIVAHYWSIAARKEGGKEAVLNFPRECQRALDSLWNGEGERSGLQVVFPLHDHTQRMRPGKMARIRWPQVAQGTESQGLFDDLEKVARRAAALVLFLTLREVK